MKTMLIVIFSVTTLMLTGFCNLYGQTKADTIIDPIEPMPEFQGGEKELFCFLDKNLDKKKLINKKGISVVNFTVDSVGQVKDIVIIKTLDSIVDNEFMRVVKLMPRWTPAKISEKTITTRITLPLRLPYKKKFCR